MPDVDSIRESLAAVPYPGFSRDIVSFGLVRNIEVEGGKVTVHVEVTTSDQRIPGQIDRDIRQVLLAREDVQDVAVELAVKEPAQAAAKDLKGQGIPGVKHIVAVASGKGGVGKSTVTSNLAVAAVRQGYKVGLLDCDLYGPSMALMFGAEDERPVVTEEEKLVPIEKHGIRLMSMAFLVGEDAPVILRGPMVTRYTQQFLSQTEWGELDILFLDLPPGTGDIQLTLVQTVALSGAIIVTTPQEVALIDARKAARMFEKVSVPLLGLVENMSYFHCPGDGKKYYIFGEGGGKREADRLKTQFLAEIPLEMEIREGGDQGRPISMVPDQSEAARAFETACKGLFKKLEAT
jgi:ATP-binding protein involved in chromosome partitioning